MDEILTIPSWIQAGFIHGFCNSRYDVATERGRNDFLKVVSVYEIKELLLLKQVHGIDFVEVDSPKLFQSRMESADGWLIKENSKSNKAFGIITADCVPVIVFDLITKKRTILHCGWRGAVCGLLVRTIERMIELGSKVVDMELAMGPSALSCCYEVQDDFIIGCKSLGYDVSDFIIKRSNKKYISVVEILSNQADGLKIKHQYQFNICTICDKRFFSYRRNKTKSRALSFMV